jgi:hypothetical protein
VTSPTAVSYSFINGVPLYYIRNGYEQRITVSSTSHHKQKMEWFISDFQSAVPSWYGSMTKIFTAGAYVNKPGAHGAGRAFDIDAIVWSGTSTWPYYHHHSSSNQATRRRYLGLNAFCQRQFKYVLSGWYNAAHRDHIHVDDYGGGRVLRKDYRSDVVFIQAMCNNLMGSGLAIDGIYGPNTDYWYRESKRRVNVTGDTSGSVSAWRLWCYRTGVRALNNQSI